MPSQGQRHSAYDDATGTIPLSALLADLDARKALRVELPYGTLYLRRPGQRGDYFGLCTGSGGGLAWKREIAAWRAEALVETGVEAGSELETGDVWPSKWDGGSR